MPELGDLLGPESTVFQLFVWQVLGSLISAALGPYILELSKLSNRAHQAAVPSPEELAAMVIRGHLDVDAAAEAAADSGMPGDWFTKIVQSAGNPPGPQQLAEALRRGIIGEGSPGDLGPSYLGGIAQGDLQNIWADVIRKLALALPSPDTAVEAAVRSMRDAGTAQTLYALFGGDPEYFQLMFDVSGQGPSPVEAGALANRGIIPWAGTGPDAVSFEQAVAESRYKNKWTPAYRALAVYRPPPRTITAMFREGSIDKSTATRWLLDYGVTQDAIPIYLSTVSSGQTKSAKELTESEIVTGYRDRATSKADAQTLLVAMGYPAEDAAFILDTVDAEVVKKYQDQTVTIVHNLFVHGRQTLNEASGALDAAGVPATQRDDLLRLWQLEVKQVVKVLSEGQVTAAAKLRLISTGDAVARLVKLGYAQEDATLLLEIKLKTTDLTSIDQSL